MRQLGPAFFIAGTGTGVGKTWVTGLLAHHFVAAGQSVSVIKWVQTGADDDIKTIQRWVPEVNGHTCMRFPAPISPHLAAEREGKSVSVDDLLNQFANYRKAGDVVLTEASGGLFTPISRQKTFADLAHRAGLPVVVVAGNYVGALHHTISTIWAAKAMGLNIAALVLSDYEAVPRDVAQDNSRFLSDYFAVPVIRLPHFGSFSHAAMHSTQCGLFATSPFIIADHV